jgi:predicted nucleic acid-binding Zn ribbon protein
MCSRSARCSYARDESKQRETLRPVTSRDEPVHLGDAIAKVGKELGVPTSDAFSALTARWPDIVGPMVAAHATVRSVRDGECTIEVDGPVWATQLRYAASEVLERANAHCGGLELTSVRVVVASPRKAR